MLHAYSTACSGLCASEGAPSLGRPCPERGMVPQTAIGNDFVQAFAVFFA